MDQRILKFLRDQSVFNFCTSRNNEPHCASCMFVFWADHNILIFSSERTTRHIANARLNYKIAGTILPDKIELVMTKGIQFTGNFIIPEGEMLENAKNVYYRKYPFAQVMKGEIWMIQLETIKMTDRTLGFGKKISWEQNAPHEL